MKARLGSENTEKKQPALPRGCFCAFPALRRSNNRDYSSSARALCAGGQFSPFIQRSGRYVNMSAAARFTFSMAQAADAPRRSLRRPAPFSLQCAKQQLRRHFRPGSVLPAYLSAKYFAIRILHNVRQNAYRCLPPGGNPGCRY